MNEWLSSLEQIARLLLGNPGSSLEFIVVAVVGVLVYLLVLSKAGAAFGIANTGFFYSLVVGALGAGLILAAMTAVKLYLPWWKEADLRVWLLVGAGLVASLVLVVPLMCGIQRTGYVGALLTWICSVAATAVVIALLGGAFDMFSSGSKSAGKGVDRKNQIQGIIDQ